jgi:hypothetical protein
MMVARAGVADDAADRAREVEKLSVGSAVVSSMIGTRTVSTV